MRVHSSSRCYGTVATPRVSTNPGFDLPPTALKFHHYVKGYLRPLGGNKIVAPGRAREGGMNYTVVRHVDVSVKRFPGRRGGGRPNRTHRSTSNTRRVFDVFWYE